MKSTEGKLQAEIVQYLQSKGIFFFSVANEAAGRSAVAQMQLIAMGLRAGASDLVVVQLGMVTFLEIKAPDGKQSPAQEKFQKKVESLGYSYHIARSIADVETIFT